MAHASFEERGPKTRSGKECLHAERLQKQSLQGENLQVETLWGEAFWAEPTAWAEGAERRQAETRLHSYSAPSNMTNFSLGLSGFWPTQRTRSFLLGVSPTARTALSKSPLANPPPFGCEVETSHTVDMPEVTPMAYLDSL
jgi:hypothetical protein